MLRPGGLLRPHHAQPPPRRDALAPLARLGGPAAGEPPVPRALPVPPLSPPQPRVHGGRARLLPRAPGQGPLRLPPRPRVLLRRARRAARDPRRPRPAGRRGRSSGSPGRLRRLFPQPPRPAHGARVADRRRRWSSGTPSRAVEGFGPREEDARATQGFTRRLTFPFRLTGARAGFDVPLPPGDGPRAPLARRGPPRWRGAAAPRPSGRLDGAPARPSSSASSPRPVRRPPASCRRPSPTREHRPRRRSATTTLARSRSAGARSGLHVGAQWVLAQRLPGPPRSRPPSRASGPSAAPRTRSRAGGSPRQALYLAAPHASPARSSSGPGDEDQLGPGWFGREAWGKLGAMRWTGGRAEAYLGHDGPRGPGPWSAPTRASRASARSRGGSSSSAWSPTARRPRPGEAPFSLAPDTWAELAVPFRPPAGLLRITLHAEPLRVPRERVPGSGDGRGLGLAIKRLWLAP